MEKRIVFRGMEKTQPMEDYCNQQLAKVEKLLENEREPIFINMILEPSKVRAHHYIEVRVKTPDIHTVSKYEGPQFYDVVDRVVDTMYRNIIEERKRLIEHRREEGRHDDVKKQK